MGAAILRAVHELYDEPPKILNDPVVPLLVDHAVLQQVTSNTQWMNDRLVAALRSHIVLRSRYAEDCLREAVDDGVQQCVILGSGFDTFAYRQPAWASALRIFEVDHPASQRAKLERLTASKIPVPSNVEFVSGDFETASLPEILQASSLDFAGPAFFSCLGVLVYLDPGSTKTIFRLAGSFPKRSELVFSFSQGNRAGAAPGGIAALEKEAAALGEPWRAYYDPDALCRELLEAGFSSAIPLSPEEASRVYYRSNGDGLPPPRRTSIIRAIV